MPLTSSRPVVAAAIATGIAASTIAIASVPAQASSVRHGEWWLTALGVRRAWTASQGTGVTVALLSDGVNPQQPDLVNPAAVITGPDFTGARQSGPRFGALGTGLASIIAGHGHAQGAAAGMMGIAPRARILSVRVTLPAGDPRLASVAASLPDAIARGIHYAVSQGATVIDLPIDPGQPGASGTGGNPAAAGGSNAERSAVAYALAHNVVLVAPAGDNGAGSDAPSYPAAYPGVIAVGAFGPGFVKTSWTSRQSYVTITAAGASMVAANASGGYQGLNGTSAASAVATGVAAMIRSDFPSLSVGQVRQALISGTVFRHPNGLASGSGYGAINAQRALAAAATEVPAAERAGAGSLPLATLPKPAPQSAQSTVTHEIIKAAAISAGVLVVLLLGIAGYAASRRRRAVRQRQAIAAEWAGRGQSRYPQAAGADADRMLEYFASPVTAQPTAPHRPAERAGRPAAGHGSAAGAGVFAGAGRESGTIQAAARSAAAAGVAGPPGGFGGSGLPGASPWAGADGSTRSPVGPASRAVTRRPSVSGAPPWEPASQPDGDLPWSGRPEQQHQPSPAQPGGAALPPTSAPSPPRLSGPRHAAAGHAAAGRSASPSPASAPASAPPDWSADSGYGPAGSEPVTYQPRGQRMTGRLDWSQEAPASDALPAADYPAGEIQRPGAPLPVRQPRQHLQQPLSPSGSLWERAVDPASSTAEGQDPGGRPIYVWNPAESPDDAPAQSSDLTDWGGRERPRT